MEETKNIKIGDSVLRLLSGTIPMVLKVTDLTDELIICGDWTFDRKTGAEIDEDLGWGPKTGITGSFLKLRLDS